MNLCQRKPKRNAKKDGQMLINSDAGKTEDITGAPSWLLTEKADGLLSSPVVLLQEFFM
jgi:hypothetical protein